MKFENSDVNFAMKLNWVRRHRAEGYHETQNFIDEVLNVYCRESCEGGMAFMEEKALNLENVMFLELEHQTTFGVGSRRVNLCLGLMLGSLVSADRYDTLLLAFDMDMILHTHTHSISKRLFSRMISLYDHHGMQDKIIEIFADMEKLRVKPDEDTIRIFPCAFPKLGPQENGRMVCKRYGYKWTYIHFKGEMVKVRRDG